MNFEEAKILSERHINKAKTLHVTSDGAIYINSDIEALEKHSIDNNIELFHIKPEIKATKKINKNA